MPRKVAHGARASFLLAGALLLGVGSVGPSNDDASATEISAVGEAAFRDITTCLSSEKSPTLDVFYLVDLSGSLSWTDPNNQRVDVLSGSVAELGRFAAEGVAVEAKALGFANGLQPMFDWAPVTDMSDSQELAGVMGSLIERGMANNEATDWEAGLQAAYQDLANRDTSCQMLIWFTDGGINPSDGDFYGSLERLCQPGISDLGLPSGGSAFGLMQGFRSQGIPIFGVLLNNAASQLERFESVYPDDFTDRLALETWLKSFMLPLVEGRGAVQGVTAYGATLVGGPLQCGELTSAGFAPAGQANGAFIDAADPVLLAFQFLRLSSQISGAAGSPIIDGRFSLPPGAVSFHIITDSDSWSLTGPDGSEVTATPTSPGGTEVSSSGGVTRIDFRTNDEDQFVGEWLFDSGGTLSELFVLSGLTVELDRDRLSTVIGDFDNTLTGQIERTAEYRDVPVNIDRFPGAVLDLESLVGDGRETVEDVEIEVSPSGSISISGFNPAPGQEQLQLWLTFNLGPGFEPLTNQFDVTVVDKAVLATPDSDSVRLESLDGPSGAARGQLVLAGPTLGGPDSSRFCLDDSPVRISDNQTGIETRERLANWSWTFGGMSASGGGLCVDVAQGQSVTVPIVFTNPTQADSEVTTVWAYSSSSDESQAALESLLTVSFESTTQSNQTVELIVEAILVAGGLLAPLGLMWVVSWWFTRFLSLTNSTRAVFPVRVMTQGSPVVDRRPKSDGQPLQVGPDDFKYLPVLSRPRRFDTGSGQARARVPWFPLRAPWFEWEPPSGHRIISSYLGASQKGHMFQTGKLAEVSPVPAENWALIIPESKLGDPLKNSFDAELVVFSPMRVVNDYQRRIQDISSTPGLVDRVKALAASVAENAPGDPDDSSGGEPVSVATASQTGYFAAPTAKPQDVPPKPRPLSGPLAPPPPPSSN